MVCTCQGCGVQTPTLGKVLYVSTGLFAFIHGALFFGRIIGSSDDASAAVSNNLRGFTGDNATAVVGAAKSSSDNADTAMRIISNGAAFLGNVAGLLGVRAYGAGNVHSRAFLGYLWFLVVYLLFTLVYIMIAIADIENYCEKEDSDGNCEDSSVEWAMSVLFVYQGISMLTLWAAWSFHQAHHSPTPAILPIPMVTAQPMKATDQDYLSHGNHMAQQGFEGNGKGQGKGGGRVKCKGGGKGDTKIHGGSKGGKGGPPRQPPSTRRVIPIYQA